MMMLWIGQVAGVTPWEHLVNRLQSTWYSIEEGSMDALLAIAVALVGWGLASLLSWVTLHLLRALRFNQGIRALMRREGDPLQLEPAALGSWVVYWGVIVVSLMLAFDTLGFDLSGPVTERLRDVLPRIAVATLLLMAGVLLAMVLGSLTERLFSTGGMRGARLRGQIVTAVLTGCALLLALEQLGFAAQFVIAVGVIVVAAVGLALGLAFGLGCRDLARDFVVEYLRSLEEERRSGTPR
jgi:small-conductance mechanosensitive channel